MIVMILVDEFLESGEGLQWIEVLLLVEEASFEVCRKDERVVAAVPGPFGGTQGRVRRREQSQAGRLSDRALRQQAREDNHLAEESFKVLIISFVKFTSLKRRVKLVSTTIRGERSSRWSSNSLVVIFQEFVDCFLARTRIPMGKRSMRRLADGEATPKRFLLDRPCINEICVCVCVVLSLKPR